jgi:hypothetical protein
MNLLEIFLGQIPEAIYFALFMILAKQLKEKRLLLTVVMIIEYVLLFNIISFSIWSHVLFFATVYILMKVLYKEKCNITDVFTLGIASLMLIPISIVSYFITFGNIIITSIVSRILMFLLLYLFRNKLCNIKKLYNKLWNRNDKVNKKMKSTTFRSLNVVIFNFMFYAINLGMIAAFIIMKWR